MKYTDPEFPVDAKGAELVGHIPICAPRHVSALGPVDKALSRLSACKPRDIIGLTASIAAGLMVPQHPL